MMREETHSTGFCDAMILIEPEREDSEDDVVEDVLKGYRILYISKY